MRAIVATEGGNLGKGGQLMAFNNDWQRDSTRRINNQVHRMQQSLNDMDRGRRRRTRHDDQNRGDDELSLGRQVLLAIVVLAVVFLVLPHLR